MPGFGAEVYPAERNEWICSDERRETKSIFFLMNKTTSTL